MAEYKRHQGHRQRMRERVQNYGLDSLADHEVLEYILYTTNAQRDTNEIAYNLLERFGDFASVLEASEEELCTVEGIGPTSARLLHMLPQVSRYYGRCRTDGKRCFKTTEQLGSYLMEKFAWSDYERAMLVSLSTRRHIKAAVWLREGTSDRVSLDVKDVVATAIKGGTDAVVLCHNHPNGVALPSMEDMEATGSIARALQNSEENVFNADVFILHLLGLLFRSVEGTVQVARDIDFLRVAAGAGHARQLRQLRVHRSLKAFKSHAHLFQQLRHEAVFLLQKRGQQRRQRAERKPYGHEPRHQRLNYQQHDHRHKPHQRHVEKERRSKHHDASPPEKTLRIHIMYIHIIYG